MVSVVVITHSFPYGTAEPFVGPELDVLSEELDRVVIVPMRTVGAARRVPSNVVVDRSLGASWPQGVRRATTSLRAAVGSKRFYRELVQGFPGWLHWRGFARLIAAVGDGERIRRWLPSLIDRFAPDSDTVVYTYWLGPATLALADARLAGAEFRLVSRAHRIDLYRDEHPLDYLPMWRETAERVDRLFVISEHGRRFVVADTDVADRCEVARLGVPDPGFVTAPSTDGVLRVMSCSSTADQKRLPLLIDALASICRLSPGTEVHWYHAGGGPGFDELLERAGAILAPTLSWELPGHVGHDDLMARYRDHPVDVFVNVSRSEGVPVSIMEALSCGVPVVATDVGGTGELVDDGCGVLLASDPSPTAVGRALLRFGDQGGVTAPLRRAARERWRTRCWSDQNYMRFARQLSEVAREDRAITPSPRS